jgi:hypothetical protein
LDKVNRAVAVVVLGIARDPAEGSHAGEDQRLQPLLAGVGRAGGRLRLGCFDAEYPFGAANFRQERKQPGIAGLEAGYKRLGSGLG